LLGALAQAAALQSDALPGKLVESSGKLPNLRKGVYQASLPATDELTRYDILLESPDANGPATAAAVFDCSGELAQQMLEAKQPFHDSHPLKKPTLAADALILVVDASAPNKQLMEEFHRFGHWLMHYHLARGRRIDVGDLPIFLVLNKCDLLAKPGDTHAMWLKRMEEGKRRIELKFRDYLKKQGSAFGSLQLRLCATAIKTPLLADRPAQAQEPFGVAELFRQGLQSATEYAQRQSTSQHRLHNIVIAVSGFLALLTLGAAFLIEYQPENKRDNLLEKVLPLLPNKDAQTPAARVSGNIKKLDKKRQDLAAIEKDEDFESLPEGMQHAVRQYRQELTDYLRLYGELQQFVKAPRLAKNEQEYLEQEKLLDRFTCPPDLAETSVCKRAARIRKEYQVLNEEKTKEVDWLTQQQKTNTELLDQSDALFKKLRDKKRHEAETTEWKEQKLENKFEDQIAARPANDRETFIPHVSGIKYEDLTLFQNVKEAREDWERSRYDLRERLNAIKKMLRKKSN
jgi:hypothetical protein